MMRALWIALALVGLAGLVLAGDGCAGKLQPLPTQAKQCAVNQIDPALADAAKTAASSPDPAAWLTFATGELLGRGLAIATCTVLALLQDLDAKLPAPADSVGHVVGLRTFMATPDPNALAHNRLVDWLHTHGVDHAHPGAP
jgi:hypothetical protein